MNTKIKLLFANDYLKEKPKEDEMGKWVNKFKPIDPQEIDLEDLLNKVGNKGCSFCPIVAENTNLKDSFISAQLLVLDFDKDISPNEVLKRIKDYDLPSPNAIYRTLSDPLLKESSQQDKMANTKKFRVLYKFKNTITEFESYKNVLKMAQYIFFPEADKLSPVQKYLGGKELIYSNLQTDLDVDLFINRASLVEASKMKTTKGEGGVVGKYFKKYKNVSDFAINTQNGYKKTNSLINNIEGGKNLPIRDFNWNIARTKFPLLNSFLNCDEKILHPQLVGLLTGMALIEGGMKMWVKAIKNNNLINNSKVHILTWYKKTKKENGQVYEMNINSYSNDNSSLNCKLTQLNIKRGNHAQTIGSPEFCELSEAEHKLQKEISNFFINKDSGVTLLKAETGLGKTAELLKYLSEDTILALPTHELIHEVSMKLKEMNFDHNVYPPLPKLPDNIHNQYYSLIHLGKFNEARKYLSKKSKEFNSVTNSEEHNIVAREIDNYLKTVNSCTNSRLPLLVTHQRAIFTKFPKHNVLIIDEDPFNSILSFNQISLEKLNKLSAVIENNNLKLYIGQITTLCNAKPNIVQQVPDFSLSGNLDFNIIQTPELLELYKLLNSSHFIFSENNQTIYHIKKYEFPNFKKVLILSASMDKYIWSKLLGNYIWIEIPKVRHSGKRIQYSDISFSKKSMTSEFYKPYNTKLNTNFSYLPVITHQSCKVFFPDCITLQHFYNCSGSNIFTNHDIAVIGTPHKPNAIYPLIATVLNINYNSNETELEEREIINNGYIFIMNSPKDSNLQIIQRYLIESELIQACGRNRTIRNDVNTYLFSNYPLPGFEQKSSSELLDQRINLNFKVFFLESFEREFDSLITKPYNKPKNNPTIDYSHIILKTNEFIKSSYTNIKYESFV